ncbi:hypothetical protein [Ferrovibrio sp.]|uniref:hypothetical protein n=1 Tax=Ferrovibrio sp. TaxID=1917215 RepID=UPI002625D77D|nr:hypothetical protein [Ferrovibrio sp.]
MLLGRIVGWLLLALAMLALGGDGLRWLESGLPHLISLRDFWTHFDPNGPALLQSLLPPVIWDPAIVTILTWPAGITLGILGVALLILFRKRPPRRRQRFGALA